jgi:hypothetical protein
VSFAAVAQFAPRCCGGIFWKGGTRRGALAGLLAGFAVWCYTLLLPALARSGLVPIGLMEQGPFGIALLKAAGAVRLVGLDQITHAMIWSMIANIGAYVAVSLSGSQSADERGRRACSSDVFRQSGEAGGARFWRGTASGPDLYDLLVAVPGSVGGRRAFADYARVRGCAGRTRLSSPTPSSSTTSRCNWRARSARLRRASWSARW